MTELRVEQAFQILFTGREDAYGLGRGQVVRSEVRGAHYQAHLRGEGSGLGIFPLRDDGCVMFGAIDLDEPDFALAMQMTRLLPGVEWIERSRSGNAHVWSFFEKLTPAWAVRTVLRAVTESVGRPDVEIFPKQDAVREGGVGNYINLPYHGTERPILMGPRAEALQPLDLEQFLVPALEQRAKAASWERRARALGGRPPEERVRQSEYGTQVYLHECAAYIIENRHENPLQPGARNVVLFNLAKQLLNWQEADADFAWEKLNMVNDAATKPLPSHELLRLFENVRNGRFVSTGCDQPEMHPYVSPDCPIANA